MISGQMPLAAHAAMVDAWASGLSSPKIGLFTNPAVLTPNLALSTLVEPTASWYAQVTAVMGRPFDQPDSSLSCQATSHQFDYSGTDAATTVYGWFLAQGSSPQTLVAAGLFTSPVTLGTTTDSVVAIPVINFPPVSARTS